LAVVGQGEIDRPAGKRDLPPRRLEDLVGGHDDPPVRLSADFELFLVVGPEQRGDREGQGEEKTATKGCGRPVHGKVLLQKTSVQLAFLPQSVGRLQFFPRFCEGSFPSRRVNRGFVPLLVLKQWWCNAAPATA